MLVRAILCILVLMGCTSGNIFAQGEKAPSHSALCWPLETFRYSINAPTGGWLAPRKGGASHLGVDMFAPVGQSVRAIADGVVYEISNGGWGAGNVALMIRHRLADGQSFVALYGHIRNSQGLRVGQRVKACQTVGTIGPYRYAGNSHLHFGVVAQGKEPRAPYGTSKRADRNNFVDPLNFLKTQRSTKTTKIEQPPSQIKTSPAKETPQVEDKTPEQSSAQAKAEVAEQPQAKIAPKKLTNPQPVKKQAKGKKKIEAKGIPVLKSQGKSSAR